MSKSLEDFRRDTLGISDSDWSDFVDNKNKKIFNNKNDAISFFTKLTDENKNNVQINVIEKHYEVKWVN